MPFSKDAPKSRRFRIWAISFFIVFALAPTVFVIRVASRPSEPFILVNFGSTEFYGAPAIRIEVSNRMSFNVNCSIEPEVLGSGKWVSAVAFSGNSVPLRLNSSLTAHSEKKHEFYGVQGTRVRLHVAYERQLKPIEISILNKLRWLKQHYPFKRRRLFTIYEPVSDVHVNSESK